MSENDILIQKILIPAAKKEYSGNEKQIYGEVILQHLEQPQWKYINRWFVLNGVQIIRIDTLKGHLKKNNA